MLNFREITLADRELLHPYLSAAAGHGSEYSFATLFFWGYQRVAFLGQTPLFLSCFGGRCSYPLPFSNLSLVELLREDAREREIPCRIFGLTAQECEALEEKYPAQFTFKSVRDSFDYVYDIDRLADLRGKKLQAKRNHCNHFEAAYPDYRIVPLTLDLLDDCRAFTEQWYATHLENGADMDYAGERRAISRAFDNFAALHMEGVAVIAEGRMVAFSMGNRIREDTFDVNFEKARADINGAYPIVNREFARRIRERYPAVRFLNREDDMGIEGLRRAKESYSPDILLEKFVAEAVE